MQKFGLSILLIIFFIQTGFAQAPADYYITTAGKSGLELKTALHTKIKGHTTFPYTSGSTDTWDILKESDRDPANPANVILFYTGWSVSADQTLGEGWNREHVWAKVHGDFGTTNGPGTDCHHLRPCDVSVNSKRDNRHFDYASTIFIDGSGPTTCKFSDSPYVWEPRDAEKGDVARIIFYMATRYEGDDAYPDLEVSDYIPAVHTAPEHGILSTLIEWNQLDPVDAFEMNRNNVVYKYQKNRNPFIDHPEYANLIWGSPEPINIAPQVSNISYSPKPVFSTDEIQITVSASDEDGTIDSVKIFWGYSSGNLSESSLMIFSDTAYSFVLPKQPGTAVVFYKITAWDNSQAATSSSIQSFNVETLPNILPVIDNISYSPALPTSKDLLQINASVSDSDGTLKSVRLYFGFNSAVFTGFLEMVLSSEVYSASIPAQKTGTLVYFKIKATDNNDSASTSEVLSFIVNAVESVPNLEETENKIYPNPTSASVQINLKVGDWITLYSMDGKKLFTTKNPVLNIDYLAKGVYLVRISNQDMKVSKTLKLVKE